MIHRIREARPWLESRIGRSSPVLGEHRADFAAIVNSMGTGVRVCSASSRLSQSA
jgi:hypothetical protein